jgi:hypothetical protein
MSVKQKRPAILEQLTLTICDCQQQTQKKNFAMAILGNTYFLTYDVAKGLLYNLSLLQCMKTTFNKQIN